MLSSDTEKEIEKLAALWETFKGIITETDERKRIITSIIANFETDQLKGQVRKLNNIYTSISSDARLFILLILSQFSPALPPCAQAWCGGQCFLLIYSKPFGVIDRLRCRSYRNPLIFFLYARQ